MMPDTLPWTAPEPAPLDLAVAAELRSLIDGKAKPPGALGRLEALAVQIGAIQGRLDPRADRAVILLFAGDHGLTEDGVSSYPREVTAAMVRLIVEGRASISALARAAGAEVRVIDVGVAAELAPHPMLQLAKVRAGTRNAAREPAMSAEECARALACGAEAARAAVEGGAEVIALGEMGIGNTASASLLLHRLGPAPLDDCIGLGAGHDSEGLARKRRVLAAAAGRPVVVDGFISTAAALAAARLEPRVLDACVFAHSSAERGHRIMLERLGAEPVLDLALRLGEGTGAALALPILKAATAIVGEVASLAEALGQA